MTTWSERETSEEEKALDSVHRCGSLSSVLDLICLGWVLKVQLLIDVGANRLEVYISEKQTILGIYACSATKFLGNIKTEENIFVAIVHSRISWKGSIVDG